MMLRYLTAYVCTTTILFVLDMLWINGLAHDVYQNGLGPILAAHPNIPAAVTFYVLFAIGLVIFAVGPALTQNAWCTAVGWGAAFGFFTYMTYDLTNLATLQQFPLTVALLDMAWGTFLCAVAAGGGFLAARAILARLESH